MQNLLRRANEELVTPWLFSGAPTPLDLEAGRLSTTGASGPPTHALGVKLRDVHDGRGCCGALTRNLLCSGSRSGARQYLML